MTMVALIWLGSFALFLSFADQAPEGDETQ